jgi:hypothetical protein
VSRPEARGPHGGPILALTEDREAAESADSEVGWWRLNGARRQGDSGAKNWGKWWGEVR